VCPACGYRFLEDRRPGRSLLAVVGIAALLGAVVLLISGRNDGPPTDVEAGRAPDLPRVATELISQHPLSRDEAERRLEDRFTSPNDDDSAAAHCSGREPRPAHAIRRCEIRYPNGGNRQVVLLLDARGRELLSEHR
jgi:hypothetical protein